jgi:hypothetical protein
MKYSKAEGRKQKAEVGLTLAVSIALMFVAAGCSDRVSPAAPTANIEAASSAGDSTNSTSDAVVAKAPVPAPAKPTDATPVQLASATSAESASKSEAQERPAKPATSGRTRDITFDDIKFEMKKEEPFLRSMLTPKIEKLCGARIRVRGYIHPAVFQQTDLTQFVLVRDNLECCFGPGAALYDAIVIEMAPSKTTDFTNFPVTVEGVFSVEEVKYPDPEDETKEKHLAIYHLVADKVR